MPSSRIIDMTSSRIFVPSKRSLTGETTASSLDATAFFRSVGCSLPATYAASSSA